MNNMYFSIKKPANETVHTTRRVLPSVKSVSEILSRAGYRIVPASSGSEVMEAANGLKEPVRLLLTDVAMPGMNGRELFGALMDIIHDLKVLYMSGYPDEVIASRGVV